MAKIRETDIVRVWQGMAQEKLVTENGEAFQVIYPGRPNGGQGADLLDAVIRTPEGVVIGDIEIHAKSSEWQSHHHNGDPGYNRVILHVVLRRDTEITVRQDGNKVPILALEKNYSRRSGISENKESLPCQKLAGQGSEGVAHVLEAVGEVRFRDKAERFLRELEREEVEQVFYEAVMRALGYSKNKEPFQKLAHGLQWKVLERVVTKTSPDIIDTLLALLFGSAGLLPSQRSWGSEKDNYIAGLENLWATSSRHRLLTVNDWELGGVRPTNHPVRRLAAAAHVVVRFRGRGFENEFVELVRSGSVPELEKALMVDDDGYWINHSDFGSVMSPHPTLLGAERAGVIVVNVVLPFVFAISEPPVAPTALELYRNYPRLAGNALDRHMIGQIRVDSKMVNSARRQQGLIHLYQTFCTQGRCKECPLAGAGEDYLRKSLSCVSA